MFNKYYLYSTVHNNILNMYIYDNKYQYIIINKYQYI